MNLPSLNGNWIDFVVILFLILYIFERWNKGFIQGFLDVGSFLFSLMFALRFYPIASGFLVANFHLPLGIANALGFIFVAFILESVFFILTSYLFGFIDKKIIYSKTDTVLGFIPSLVSGLILSAFLLTILLVLPPRPEIKQDILSSKIGGSLVKQTLGFENTLSQVFGGAFQETLTFLTVKPQNKDMVNLNFKTNNFSTDEYSENKMFVLLNKERHINGLKALSADKELAEVARLHCKDMFAQGYFSHYSLEGKSPFDRMNMGGIIYKSAGENLAYAPTVDIAHNGLMNSPGHRANILSSDFGKVGIGIINAGTFGRMFCQEFTD